MRVLRRMHGWMRTRLCVGRTSPTDTVFPMPRLRRYRAHEAKPVCVVLEPSVDTVLVDVEIHRLADTVVARAGDGGEVAVVARARTIAVP